MDGDVPKESTQSSSEARGDRDPTDPESLQISLASFDTSKMFATAFSGVDTSKMFRESLASFDTSKVFRDSFDTSKMFATAYSGLDTSKVFRDSFDTSKMFATAYSGLDTSKFFRESLASFDTSKMFRESFSAADFSRGLLEGISQVQSTRYPRPRVEVAEAFSDLVDALDISKRPSETLAELETLAEEVCQGERDITEDDRIAIGAFAAALTVLLLTYFYIAYPDLTEFVLSEVTFVQIASLLAVRVYRRLGK